MQVQGKSLVTVVCGAQVLVQIGAFFWPALLPGLMPLWQLSNGEAGWITASFYGAYMLSVPVLVTLTDRIDPKRVYLFGVAATVVGHSMFALLADGFWSALATRALTGMGWAGTYMTGLKLLADRVDARMMSRATAGHAASIGVSGAISFACGDLIAAAAGWRMAFLVASISAAVAWATVALIVPPQGMRPSPAKEGQGLYDFRPVLRNRSAMAYAIGYCVHTLEMSALRGWGVAFLARSRKHQHQHGSRALAGLCRNWTWADRNGRQRCGQRGRHPLRSAASDRGGHASFHRIERDDRLPGQRLVHPRSRADDGLRHRDLAQLVIADGRHSGHCRAIATRRNARGTLHAGLCGRVCRSLLIGWTLDLSGGMSRDGWGVSFLLVAVLTALALVAFWLIRPRELEGDRVKAA